MAIREETVSSDTSQHTHPRKLQSPMANIKSQKKRNLQNERRRVANKGIRSEMRTRIKTATAAAEAGDPEADAKLRLAQKRIDSASSKGIIHANKAARLKSRLFRNPPTG